MKKCMIYLLIAILLIQMIPFSVSAADSSASLMAELQASTIDGKPFHILDYPKKIGADAELLAFMERGYGTDDFQMEVYLYNPSEREITEGRFTKIMFAVAFDQNGLSTHYESFYLKFVSRTDDHRFYKFTVEDHVSLTDGKNIESRLKVDKRIYEIVEFEVQYVGTEGGNASSVAKKFVFTGSEADKNISLSTSLIDVVSLDVGQTWWRSQTSSLGEGHQNQLTSAYFAVPGEYFEKYEYLQAITASWNEQRTSPILVVDNQRVYDGLCSQVGVSDSELDYNDGYGFYYKESIVSSGWVTYFFDNIYNAKIPFSLFPTIDDYISILGYVFYDNQITLGDIGVSSRQLKKHIYDYELKKWLFSDAVDEGRTKGQQIQTIYRDKLLNLESFGETHDWITTFLEYTIKNVDAYEEMKNIAPIYEVKAEDLDASKSASEIAAALYVNEADVTEIRAAFVNADFNGDKLILFRFAATDYKWERISHFFEDGKEVDCNGYIVQETVFLNFDVISLTFFKDGESFVVPVVADSQDIVSDASSPNVSEDTFVWDFEWLKDIVRVLAVVLLVAILWNPVMDLIDMIVRLFKGGARR